jgi:hypothetical protein
VRQFASSGFRIWNLGLEAKVVYTGFGLFALLALFVSVLFYEDMVGPRTPGVAGYYAGASAAAPPAAATGGGPRIEMPTEPATSPITVAVTYRKLLEVTHFHLFTLPVFLLIIAHLFMLTGLRPLTKVVWILAGFIASLAHLAAPWLIRFAGAGWSWLYVASGGLMALALTVMTVYPIVVMWTGPRAARAAA